MSRAPEIFGHFDQSFVESVAYSIEFMRYFYSFYAMSFDTQHAAKLLPQSEGNRTEYSNIGVSVSGFVDLPKNNIMKMWKNKPVKPKEMAIEGNQGSTPRDSNGHRILNEMEGQSQQTEGAFRGELEANRKQKKRKLNGIERFLSKDTKKRALIPTDNDSKESTHVDSGNNNGNSNSKKRKRKGAMFQYLKEKSEIEDSAEPPSKRRKLNERCGDEKVVEIADTEVDTGEDTEDSSDEVVCKKCGAVICPKGSLDTYRLVQTHMDEHVAADLAKQLNPFAEPPPRIRAKTSVRQKSAQKKKKKPRSGIMNFFSSKCPSS